MSKLWVNTVIFFISLVPNCQCPFTRYFWEPFNSTVQTFLPMKKKLTSNNCTISTPLSFLGLSPSVGARVPKYRINYKKFIWQGPSEFSPPPPPFRCNGKKSFQCSSFDAMDLQYKVSCLSVFVLHCITTPLQHLSLIDIKRTY